MRALLATLALALVATTFTAGEAQANPALLAARAAQIASKAAQAARSLGRLSRISRMLKAAQRARKGIGGMKMPGSLGRMRAKMRRSLSQRAFGRFSKGASERFTKMRRAMSMRLDQAKGMRTMLMRQRELRMKPFAGEMNQRSIMNRMSQMRRNQQRSTAAQNQQTEQHRRRMSRASESLRRRSIGALNRTGGGQSRSHMFEPRHGMFATAMSR